MEDISVFTDKSVIPSEGDLKESISDTFELWNLIKDYVHFKYPNSIDEWNFPGAKYGWSYRMKDKKRAIIYFLPRENYFKVAFVYGHKAFEMVMNSNVNNKIKEELNAAKQYAEGRGIRIDVVNSNIVNDIKTLIDIKLLN